MPCGPDRESQPHPFCPPKHSTLYMKQPTTRPIRISTTMATTNIFDSDVPQQGVRATESAHRKVELQSPLDLQYLIANVHRAAREKLDAHYPPPAAATAPEDDAVKQKVAELVDSVRRLAPLALRSQH